MVAIEPVGRSPAWRYAVALACVALGWLARHGLTPVVGPTELPFISFFPAVVVAALYGGLGPGSLAIALSAGIAEWRFIHPFRAAEAAGPYEIAAVGTFVISCLFIVGSAELMHRTRRRLLDVLSEKEGTQRELTQSRELLATILASIGDGVIVTDTQGRVTFLNGEAERLTGWKSDEAVGQPLPHVFRIINEHTRAPAENPVEEVLHSGMIVGLANHTLLISRDGKEIAIDDSAAPVRRPGEPPLGIVLVFRDSTERRAADRSKAHLAAIAQFSGDAIVTKNLDGVVQSWNEGAERLFGYRADEMIGQPITRLIPPDRQDEEVRILGRLRHGQPAERLETLRLAKDGRLIPVSVSVSPMKDQEGRVIGASKVVHDISEMVAAREALAQEKELLATTLASIGDGVIVTDGGGLVTFLNPEAERLTGWKSADARGRELPVVFRILNEETRNSVESPVEKVLRLGVVVGLANHTVLIPVSGPEVAIDDSAAPIRDPHGRIVGVVLVFRDVTERRRGERALLEADRHKAEFIAVLSHELRNPLAPIRLAVSMLQRIGPPEPQVRELHQVIERQTIQLTRLLDDLLDITRISSGRINLRKDRVHLGLVIANAVEAARPLIESEQHALSVNVPETPLYVHGDFARLAQVITNLLNNAAKYTDHGGTIVLSLGQQDGRAIVSVRDNGIGIPAEQLPGIFDMFVRGNERLERSPGGLGIGLSLAKRLVEMHDGRIEARSEGRGKGAEFVISLPLLAAVLPEPEASSSPAEGPVRSAAYRILVADDNVDSATILAKILRSSGHDVRTVHDGRAAVETTLSFQPNVALLDIGMPILNGYEAARRIRSQTPGPIILIAITGWGQEDDKREALSCGFDFHLTKPVDAATIEKLLAEVYPATK